MEKWSKEKSRGCGKIIKSRWLSDTLFLSLWKFRSFFVAGILPNLVAGLDQLCQHIDSVLALIIAENRWERILTGYNIFGRKPGESQCAYIGHTPSAFAYIILLQEIVNILTENQLLHNIDEMILVICKVAADLALGDYHLRGNLCRPQNCLV